MTERELRKLSRAELLEILVALSEENDRLRKNVKSLKEGAALHTYDPTNVDAIADAAARANQVMEETQRTAAYYLENIQRLSEGAQQQADMLLHQTRVRCAQMEEETQKQIEQKWAAIKIRLIEYCNAHSELRPLINQKQ